MRRIGPTPSSRRIPAWGGIGLLGVGWVTGCQDHTPPPPGPGPAVVVGPREFRDPIKPLPDPERGELPAPPFDDAPLVGQQIPEARAFVGAYQAVGQPRIAVFVNRTLQGDVIPPSNDPSFQGRFESRGPVYRETTEITLRPGEYDEAAAKAIDYAAIEAKLAEWLSAGGPVKIVSPATIREKLTDEEIQRLQMGRPRLLGDVAKNLNADVLVQVQARPTRQTPRGLEIRLIAEAINIGPVASGEALGHAMVLVPPPLDAETVNRFTRFVARKLMSDMTGAWTAPGPNPPGPGGPPNGGNPSGPPPDNTRGDPRPPADRPPPPPPPANPGPGPGSLPPPAPGSATGGLAAEPVPPGGPSVSPPPERPGSILERRDAPPAPVDSSPATAGR